MLKVVSVKKIDIYRDGGSHAVFFAGEDPGVSHELLFPIHQDYCSDWDHLRFKQPILTTYTSNPYVSPVTGISSHREDKASKSVSWAEASDLLEKISPLLREIESRISLDDRRDFESRNLELFERMVAAAANEGQS